MGETMLERDEKKLLAIMMERKPKNLKLFKLLLMKYWILLGLLLIEYGLAADFFAMYDFAYNYPRDEAFDLLGNGPKLQKIAHNERLGVHHSSKNWRKEAMKDLSVPLPSNCSSFSIITAVSFSALQTPNFFIEASLKSTSFRCGIKRIRAKNSLIFVPYCTNKNQTIEGQHFTISSSSKAISFALSFSLNTQGLDMTVFVYPSGDVIHEYKIRAFFVDFYISNLLFSNNLNEPGEVYYLGFASQNFTMHEFQELANNSQAHFQKISCPNCEGNPSDLRCPESSYLMVGKNIRSYFCKCPLSYGYMDSSSKCEKIEFGEHNPYCPKGCSTISRTYCFEKCQNSYISDHDGEFVSCSPFSNLPARRPRYSHRIDPYDSSLNSVSVAEEEENYRQNMSFTTKKN